MIQNKAVRFISNIKERESVTEVKGKLRLDTLVNRRINITQFSTELLLLLWFPHNRLNNFLVSGACHVYDLNQFMILTFNHHIWFSCYCFLFHPIFKVPVQLYLVLIYNRLFLSHLSLDQYRYFFDNSYSTAHVAAITLKALCPKAYRS